MDKLLDGFQVDGYYIITLVIFSILIRVLLTLLRALQYRGETEKPYWKSSWQIFLGFPMGREEDDLRKADYWYNYLLGLIELGGYSILIAAKQWNLIGAWLGFKTLAQWNVWKNDRTTFNRFLIGNALIVAVAFFFLAPHVNLDASSSQSGTPADSVAKGDGWFGQFPADFELYAQIIAAGLFLLGTLFLAFSHEPYNPKYKKTHYMPTKIIQWRFRLGISLNFLGFLLIILSNLSKIL